MHDKRFNETNEFETFDITSRSEIVGILCKEFFTTMLNINLLHYQKDDSKGRFHTACSFTTCSSIPACIYCAVVRSILTRCLQRELLAGKHMQIIGKLLLKNSYLIKRTIHKSISESVWDSKINFFIFLFYILFLVGSNW